MRTVKSNSPADPAPLIDDGNVESWQSIILFESVLNSEKLMNSQEIRELMRYFYGQARMSVVRTEYTDDLQFWLCDKLFAAEIDDTAETINFTGAFDEMVTMDNNGEFSGPLKIISIKPEKAEKDFLVLTCLWRNGQFYNDNHVIGIIADTDDLFNLIDTKFH